MKPGVPVRKVYCGERDQRLIWAGHCAWGHLQPVPYLTFEASIGQPQFCAFLPELVYFEMLGDRHVSNREWVKEMTATDLWTASRIC